MAGERGFVKDSRVLATSSGCGEGMGEGKASREELLILSICVVVVVTGCCVEAANDEEFLMFKRNFPVNSTSFSSILIYSIEFSLKILNSKKKELHSTFFLFCSKFLLWESS